VLFEQKFIWSTLNESWIEIRAATISHGRLFLLLIILQLEE